MTLDPKSTLGELATTHPVASRVFQAHQLDYCCGGGRSLEEACARKGLDPASILDEIAAEESVNPDLQSWVGRPLDQIIQHIVDYYHARLRRELPELESLAMRVEHRHALHPDVPDGLAHILRAMQEDVFDHLAKEERILFPLIAAGRGAEAGGPIHAMEAEHEDTARDLARIRKLTNEYRPPADACTSWRALFMRLAAFESEFMEHVHLENNVLFPAALCR